MENNSLVNIHQLERNVTKLSAQLTPKLYLETITIPTSKLIFTQSFLMQYRINYHTNRIKKQHRTRNVYYAKGDYENVRVAEENSNYVIVGGNCTSYAVIKLGFKQIKVALLQHEAIQLFRGRRFHKHKPIRKTINEIIILKNSYDYNENNRKLLWFTVKLSLRLLTCGFNSIDYHHEGHIIDINKNTILIPQNYTIHQNRQTDEPLLLVKRQENTHLIIDGIERLASYRQTNKNEIEAWIFTIYPQHPMLETWLKQIPHEFNKTWNDV